MVLTDDVWYIVRNTRGCTGFVGPESEPIPLTEQEVQRMGVGSATTVELDYGVGDSVKVVSGPYEGFIGVVDEIDTESGRVHVVIDMYGRDTMLEMNLEQVVPLG